MDHINAVTPDGKIQRTVIGRGIEGRPLDLH
jgi:hypothetical protein